MFTHSKTKLAKPIYERFVAHRGANNEAPGNTSQHLPENTLPAMLEAYNKNACYVECDIHLTSDNKIIVLHDATLRRTARYNPDIVTTLSYEEYNKILDTQVASLNYEAHISQVDVGSYADYLGDKFRGTKIPLLSEFLDQLVDHPERKLIVELKSGSHTILNYLSELIRGYKLKTNQLIFISFDFELITASKLLLVEYQHLLLTVCDNDIAVKEDIELSINSMDDLQQVICMTKAAKLDGIDLQYSAAADSFIPEINKHHLTSAVWTYPKDDNLTMAKSMLAAGADLINTNQPEYMFAQLKAQVMQPNHLSALKPGHKH